MSRASDLEAKFFAGLMARMAISGSRLSTPSNEIKEFLGIIHEYEQCLVAIDDCFQKPTMGWWGALWRSVVDVGRMFYRPSANSHARAGRIKAMISEVLDGKPNDTTEGIIQEAK